MALSFGDAYKAEGNYLTLIVMNFVIAVAMLMTPMMVKSIVGSGLQSMSSALGAAAVTAMAAAPAKAAASVRTSRALMSDPKGFVSENMSKAFNPNHFKKTKRN